MSAQKNFKHFSKNISGTILLPRPAIDNVNLQTV